MTKSDNRNASKQKPAIGNAENEQDPYSLGICCDINPKFHNNSTDRRNFVNFRPAKISDFEKLKKFICRYIWTHGTFSDNHRNNDNFIQTQLLVLDIDNIPEHICSLEQVTEHFADYKHIIATSKSHRTPKTSGDAVYPPDDRLRVILFLEEPITSVDAYNKTWQHVFELFPIADIKAKDAAHYWLPCNEVVSANEKGALIPVVESENEDENGQPVSIEGEIPEELQKLESRQLQLMKKEVPDKFLVVGAGGVGFWFIVTMLAVNPQSKFLLFDSDVVESTNLERIPFPPSYTGMLKVDALKSWVQVIYQRGSSVISVPHRFRTEFFEHLIFKPDCVIECSDDYATQRSIYEYCKKNELPFYKIGTISNRVTISNYVPGDSWNAVEEGVQGVCGQNIPQWQPTQMIAAAELTSMIMRNEPVEINLFQPIEKEKKVRSNEHTQEETEIPA